MEEQETILTAFDDKEAQWQEALAKASSELQQLTAPGTVHEISESEDMEIQAAEEQVDKAIAEQQQEEQRREEQKQQNQKVKATLETLRQQAQANADAAKRDGSRTPRRQTSQATEPGADSKDDKVDPKAGAVPGKAR